MNPLPARTEPMVTPSISPVPPAGAERLRWRRVARRADSLPRRPLRLWFPLTALLLVLSPLLLLVLAFAVFLPRPIGVNPIHLMLGVGRVLMALSGSQVDIDNDRRPVTIHIV